MESLPNEMVLTISKDLTPEDIARCCGVSTTWREIFNQDWLWKPHCDPELEEHLRTTPCVVEPAFVSPEDEDSTLAPMSQWRLAFLREKHFYNNWKNKNFKEDNTILSCKDSDEFLTESHIVRWFERRVEIWEVSVIPAKRVIKSVIPDKLATVQGMVVDSHTLIVEKKNCVAVLEVDLLKKCINLKHNIYVDNLPENIFCTGNRRVLKERMFLCIGYAGSKLTVCDIDTGTKVREEPCPVLEGEGMTMIYALMSSPTSDDVLVLVRVPEKNKWYDYVYSPKQLHFLLGPLTKSNYRFSVILGKYLAYPDLSMKIYNYYTSELIIEIPDDDILDGIISVFNDCFIFIELNLHGDNKLKMFSPTNKAMTTLCQNYHLNTFLIIKNKFLQPYCWKLNEENVILETWEIRSGKLAKMSIPIDFDYFDRNPVFNRWFTIVLDSSIYHYW